MIDPKDLPETLPDAVLQSAANRYKDGMRVVWDTIRAHLLKPPPKTVDVTRYVVIREDGMCLIYAYLPRAEAMRDCFVSDGKRAVIQPIQMRHTFE